MANYGGASMDIEELEPRKSKAFEIGCDLSNHSIEELKELAEKLGDEISRIQTEVRSKESSRDAAASVFKS
jgi:uncharacterized small protein (DUF1192 family)